jgi:hypothetical protein
MHNNAAIEMTKHIPQMRGVPPRQLRIYRFFVDGLIVHFHQQVTQTDVSGLFPMLVGEATTEITTVTFEASWQLENLANVIADAEHEFPGGRARAEGRSGKLV